MSTNQVNCQNCEKPYEEGFQFCPHCGQKTNDELTIGVLFYNTISNYFSFDARFLKSFIPLMFKPGYLAKEFIKGKRLLFLHPAQMYLFVSVVFFFLFSFNARQQVQSLDENLAKTLIKASDTITDQHVLDSLKFAKVKRRKAEDSIGRAIAKKTMMETSKFTGMTETQIDSIINSDKFKASSNNGGFNFNFDDFGEEVDSLIAINAPDKEIYKKMGMNDDAGYFKRKIYAQALKFYKSRKGGSILQAFYDTIPIAMFFLLPFFALILKILYYKRGRYSHHLVFSFYYFSFLFTVFSILVGIDLIWPEFPGWIIALITLSTIFYLFIALQKFYRQGWIWSFFKTGFVAFMFLLFVIPLTIVILGIFAFMFY
ncbi:hypothetical protein FBALC1_08013 [Flavobacteriales bacterium ALC-1]|nr:hypothetical protein FBALC1_08013 [Flavobacteriales bacterium ALC-1]